MGFMAGVHAAGGRRRGGGKGEGCGFSFGVGGLLGVGYARPDPGVVSFMLASGSGFDFACVLGHTISSTYVSGTCAGQKSKLPETDVSSLVGRKNSILVREAKDAFVLCPDKPMSDFVAGAATVVIPHALLKHLRQH